MNRDELQSYIGYELRTDEGDKAVREKVFEYLRRIPAGKVVTYGQIADYLGSKNLARPVGNILHSNPDPSRYPCHRV